MQFWDGIRPYFSGLVRFLHISYIETVSEHRGAYLGILWVPLSSLLFSALLALVFHHSESKNPTEFFLYVLTGYVFWNFISDSVTGSTDVIQKRFEFAVHNNLSLVGLFGKLLIDRLFQLFLNFSLVILVILIFAPEKIGANILLIIPFLGLIVTSSLGIAYLVNLVTIFYPDTRTLFSVGMRFMFFASPVFWSAHEVMHGPRAFLVKFNPAAYYLSILRQIFAIEPFAMKAWIIAAAASAVVGLTGFIAYRSSQGFIRNLK